MPQGSFTSPNYPDTYPDEADCPTRITTTADYRILLVFLDVDLEELGGNQCYPGFDGIDIYDSYKEDGDKLIGQVCGTEPEQTVFTSSGDSMFVHFTSDASIGGTGFNAIFYTYPGNYINCSQFVLSRESGVSNPGRVIRRL